MWLIKLPILIITLSMWAIVGFVFWIPLLARTTAVYSSTIMYANLTRSNALAHGKRLQDAVTYYPDGFSNIIQSLYGDPKAIENGDDDGGGRSFWRFVLDSLWTVIFWLTTLIFIYKAEWIVQTYDRMLEIL